MYYVYDCNGVDFEQACNSGLFNILSQLGCIK